jgi:hypothetical protein
LLNKPYKIKREKSAFFNQKSNKYPDLYFENINKIMSRIDEITKEISKGKTVHSRNSFHQNPFYKSKLQKNTKTKYKKNIMDGGIGLE